MLRANREYFGRPKRGDREPQWACPKPSRKIKVDGGRCDANSPVWSFHPFHMVLFDCRGAVHRLSGPLTSPDEHSRISGERTAPKIRSRHAPGEAASTPEEAEQAARDLGTNDSWSRRRSMPAGEGRGRSPMVSKVACTCANRRGSARDCFEDARSNVGHASDRTRGTRRQQGPGRGVRRDRARNLLRHSARSRDGGPIIVASTEGGVEIEAVAEKSPEKILREKIDPWRDSKPIKHASWPSSLVQLRS